MLLQDRSDYIALNLSCPNSLADRDFFDELPVERLERLFELGDLLGREALPRPVIRVLLETLSLGVDTSDGLLVLVFVADHGGTPSLSLIA